MHDSEELMLSLGIDELQEGYRQRAFSPVEILSAVLQRADAVQGTLNPLAAVDPEGAMAAARESEARWQAGQPLGPLDGVPITVKDLMPTANMPTRLGSREIGVDTIPRVDAPAAARCREAGAILFAKATTSEFGNKIVTESPLNGITRNPWNPARSSGGSSGGSAVAVAAGLGPVAIATDGGGSVRIPSCWCGVVGFKPSYKRVPTLAMESFGSLSNVGPIARSVTDAARLLTVMAGPFTGDWQATPHDGRDYRHGLEDGVRGLRIAYSPDLGIAEVQDDIAAAVAACAKVFSDLGAIVEPAAVDPLQGYVESRLHSIQWMVNLAHFLGQFTPEERALVDPDTLELAKIGEGLPASALAGALSARERLGREMHAFLTRYDLLICPTFHVEAPAVPGMPSHLQEAPRFTSWCNQTMQPAASVPCGFTRSGLPVGLQIVGRRYNDALVLRAAAAYETARGPFPMPKVMP
jgi:aspartyl-tRNA(Asn)/glutamyl-tRNA(Gln) amidotransferase subunit A